VIRAVLVAALVASAAPAQTPDAPPAAPAAPSVEERSLKLWNTHTNAKVDVVYKRDGEFDPVALAELDKVLIDHRSSKTTSMDRRLFDQLFDLAAACGVAADYEIISGYRAPESNAKMAAREGSGVAKKSLHMQGRAIDVRLRKCPTTKLRDLALEAKQGGVGYYERSDFVHVDTGSFRTWVGK
jgi:uncharacterized protein YcbK (DUF882 family)